MDFTKNKNKPKKQTKNPGYKYRISCDIHVIGENINRKMQHNVLFQVSPSVLKLHCYWFKRHLLWFLLVLYSQIPLLLNLIFTKFDKHANLLHYRESERKDPVGLEPHGIRLFYSLLIVLAKNKR